MKSKRILSFLIVAVMLLAAPLSAFAYSDVATSHWAYKTITDMTNKGVMSGYSGNVFKPEATVTNAEFISMLVNAYCTESGTVKPAAAAASQKWYEPAFRTAIANGIMVSAQFSGKENKAMTRADMALLVSNTLSNTSVPSNKATVINKYADSATINKLNTSYQNAIAKVTSVNIMAGDSKSNFNPNKSGTRAEASSIIANFMTYYPTQKGAKVVQDVTILIAAAASLKNAFEKSLIPEFEKINSHIKIKGTYDSSGKLQTQIESGLEADIFFSAATKQMDELKNKKLINANSIIDLLENVVVLIVPKGSTSKVTNFNDITNAAKIAVGDPDSVPAGQYAKEIFTNLGNWDEVLKKASLGTNVTEVLSWVAAASADAGVVYATDAASNSNVTVIAKAPAGSLKTPVVYPIGIVTASKHTTEAQTFINFLKTDTAKAIFEQYGFTAK